MKCNHTDSVEPELIFLYPVYGSFIHQWDSEHPSPVVPGSYRHHSYGNLFWGTIFLGKNTVYNLIQGSVAANRDDFPEAGIYGLSGRIDSVAFFLGELRIDRNIFLFEQTRNPVPVSLALTVSSVWIYNSVPFLPY